MSDAFTRYERGLKEFQQKLGEQHQRLLDFLNYDHQLRTNIRQARHDGETPILSAERNRIVRQLNALALETVGISFNEMCGLGRHEPVLTMPIVKLSPPVTLFFNLVVVIILALILRPLVSAWLPCISPLASAPSLAIILLVLFNLIWRHLNPVIKASGGTVEMVWIAVPIQVLASLADALHPWTLSDVALWVLAIVLSLAAVILGISPLSPFPPPCEETPIVQRFSVQYLERDEMTISFKPGDVVEINAGELVLVQAETLGQDGAVCTWSAANGSLQPAEGCATLYSAPFSGTHDILDVLAQSPCKTQSASASLHITVVLSNQ